MWKLNVQALERPCAVRSNLHSRKLGYTPESLVALGKGSLALESLVVDASSGIHGGIHGVDRLLRKSCPLIKACGLSHKSKVLRFPSPGPQLASPMFANLQDAVLAESSHRKIRLARKLPI